MTKEHHHGMLLNDALGLLNSCYLGTCEECLCMCVLCMDISALIFCFMIEYCSQHYPFTA